MRRVVRDADDRRGIGHFRGADHFLRDRRIDGAVLHVDHDTETALLTVDDAAFFEGTQPVTFGELPHRNAKVTCIKYRPRKPSPSS